jgi:predicted transcriptional regulator
MAASGGFRIFGDLEREIMTILWRDGSGTVRSVRTQIAPCHRLAYTTVQTLLARLTQKGILTQRAPNVRHSSRGAVYTPIVTRAALMAQAIHRLQDELGATDAERRQLAEVLYG